LGETLEKIRGLTHLHAANAFGVECQHWGTAMDEYLDTKDEKKLYQFLETAVHPFLNNVKIEYPETKNIINEYLHSIDDSVGKASRNRREFDVSIQRINKVLNDYFESTQKKVQEIYPSYIAKFRTDGIEYDMYTGQSIAPDITFDRAYLKKFRQWQLMSMVEITQLTRKLLPEIPRSLETTQLIFVHANTIDISFRTDERRFDVEGAYNIRYEVIKKRIDKALIKGTQERLTQPGKIAIVYFTQLEAQEYISYINELQKQGLLDKQIEFLELEPVQGVTGLKGLRVSVK
jgi:hypothetical protein